ncbi:MAG: hypothetical protein AAF745_04810 [Planctomycetota bacterium]
MQVCLMVGLAIGIGGCTRDQYRLQADAEAYALMDEKALHVARPPNTRLRIDIDRRSRMFNPFDLDFQPMPLDDPASHRYMQCVDGRRGYPLWDAAGLTNTVESPDWWQFLPLGDDGVLELNAENAVRIAMLHSPDYQEQLEALYLSALDVSSERFRFDTQFFGGSGFAYENSRLRQGSTRTDTSELTLGNDIRMSRQFATGANLLVDFANTLVWQLSGPDTRTSTTLLDFTLLQPLLREAGRDVVMERLTLAERSLLANVRNFERFRRGFYLRIVTGRSTNGLGVQRRSNGFEGFRGIGGGFAGIGGGGGAGFGGGGAGVPDAGGFFGLLQDQLQIRNLEENIARLQETLLVLENTLVELLTTIPDDPEAIIRQRLQIAQSRSALLNAQSRLVTRRVAFQNTVDDYLTELGLPPYLCVRINDSSLDQFELIDRPLRQRREQLIAARTLAGQLNVSLLDMSTRTINDQTGLPESRLPWNEGTIAVVESLLDSIEPLSQFTRQLVQEDLVRVESDLTFLAEQIPRRLSQTESLRLLYENEKATICSLLGIETIDESIFEIEPINQVGDELAAKFVGVSSRLESYLSRVDQLRDVLERYVTRGPDDDDPAKIAEALRDDVVLASQDLLSDLGEDVLALQLIQARARVESLVLPEVEIDPATALQIARVNRRDWANARAALVDTYRAIEFIADDLESDLDVVFTGGLDTTNVTSLPTSNETRLGVGLRFDAPITRLQERNTYRQILIEYEQAKRGFYQFEDGVWQLLRSTVRQLQANRLNFELGRQSVRIAAAQLELTEDIQSFRDARGLSSGPTAARDTISALSDLLDSQNALLNISVNFEVVRRGLDLDLGTMQLTPDGMWLDPGPIEPDALLRLVGTSESGLIDCGLSQPQILPLCPVPACGLTPVEQPVEHIYGF